MLELYSVLDFQKGAIEASKALSVAVNAAKPNGVLLLFSGGSPLEILPYLPKDLCDDHVTIGVSDERFSADPTINNFSQVNTKILFKKSIDTRVLPEETLEQMGYRFDTALKQWRNENRNGTIIITQGIGLDGHTSGMMPYPENAAYFQSSFLHTDNWAVGYDAKEKNKYPLRVTTTVPFLTQQVDLSVLFVCGNDKQKPLTAVLASDKDIEAVPGRVIHHMKHCLLYTDCTVDTVGTI